MKLKELRVKIKPKPVIKKKEIKSKPILNKSNKPTNHKVTSSDNPEIKPKSKSKSNSLSLTEFIEAILNQDIQYLEMITDVFGTEFLITCNYKVQDVLYLKLTPLLIAIFNNSFEVVKWLVEIKKVKLNTVDGLPLVTAIWKNNQNMTNFLLKKKAKIYPNSVVMIKNKESKKNEIDYNIVENKNLDLLIIISKRVSDTILMHLIVSQMSFGINSQIKRNPEYTENQELELEQWMKYFSICIENNNHKLMSILLNQLGMRFERVDEKWMNLICRNAINNRSSQIVLMLLPQGADPSIITLADRIKLGWSTWKYEKKTITPMPLCLISHEDIEEEEQYVACPNTHYFKYSMWKAWSDTGKDQCPYCRQYFFPDTIYIQ